MLGMVGNHPAAGQRRAVRARAAAHRQTRPPPAEGPAVGHPRRTGHHRRLAPGSTVSRYQRYRRRRRDRRPLVRRVRQPSPAAPCWSATPASDRDAGGVHHRQRRHRQLRRTRSSARYARTAGRSRPPSPPGKQLLGIGQARNRLQPRGGTHRAARASCVYSLVIVWYALHGHHRDDLDARRRAQPWYRHKDEHRLRRHARQAPQNPCRSTNYRRCRSSARPPQIPRLAATAGRRAATDG